MLEKPLLIYDGECRFCCRWIERWKTLTGGRVEYRTAQDAAGDHPEIPAAEFQQAVIRVEPDGTWTVGAAAVFRTLASATWGGKALWGLYRHVPFFAGAAEGVYRTVARHRMVFSQVTRLLWGNDVRPPTYAISSRLFLRMLGLIYLMAFLSYYGQMEGLSGPRGILPAGEFFAQVKEAWGREAFWQLPSFCWWTGGSQEGWCLAGIGAAALLLFGVAPLPCLIFLWADYLSLVVAGQIFYHFQWDNLLLEAGFLAIFLAPWSLGSKGGNPPQAAHFLLIWLLFRLMFASGAVKLTSGDLAWLNGTALDWHYFTQPLPTPLAWYAQQLPSWLQKASVAGMYFIELVLPFFLFAPRRLRLLAAAGLAALQILIALTGNYGFFNLLSFVLCLLAVDDVVWRKVRRAEREPAEAGRFLPRLVVAPLATAIVLLSLVPLASSFRRPAPWLEPLAAIYRHVAPFRTINGYGLFAVMTKERREIIVQGSEDGLIWKTYEFRYKPGDPLRAPPWVAPYMPRLDWQMWFAALGDVRSNPWFVQFLGRLLEGSPEVLGLLECNPFPEKPPRFVRALTDDYTFTSAEERRETSAWWNVEPAGVYCPELSLRGQ